MNKTPDQITEQIGRIILRKPQLFGFESQDIVNIGLSRAVAIIMENRSRYQVLLSEHEKTIQELQLEHSKLLTAYAALEFVVRHDSLTKLPNRKELDRRIKKDITSEDTQAVFMIFDLRRFKYINDSYGHEVGDIVLTFVAGVCKELCLLYPDSLIARKGGDEFTGMFPGYTEDDIRGIADNFTKILDLHWKNRPSELQMINDPISVAMGIISFQDTNDINISIKHKDNHQPSPLEQQISKVLYKADKMSEAAKNTDTGIITTWNIDYAKEVKLNKENKELLNKLNGIIRHWISDEYVDINIRTIRELLASTLDDNHIIEEIDRIHRYYSQSNYHHDIPNPVLIEIQSQINILRQMIAKII